ncbi:hypothetical protein LshimejAT787_0204560 [Lyophyllum shimeji]|uniref:Replication protein A C-terminal domain-containing protein n=1 Tax=Lyophyllum shimeji TaxID=47721 RepID=A0A9P3PG76_LYOSH|nr:hypothetical protein LshimejAT787_0204560 [Lyophyllum shimeji]
MGDKVELRSANAHGPHDAPLTQYEHAVRHVTVRQILQAERMHSSAPYRIENQEFERVIVVANLSTMRMYEKYRKFYLDDGTGRIKAQQWNSSADVGPDWSQLDTQAFPYVRVIGAVEQYQDETSINVARLDLVSSPYEPYYHILQAIYDTSAYQRRTPPRYITRTVPTMEFPDDGVASPILASESNPAPRVPRSTERDKEDRKVEQSRSGDKGKGKADDPRQDEPSMPKVASVQAEFSPCDPDADFTPQLPVPSVTPMKNSRWPDNSPGESTRGSPPPSSPLLWSPSPAFEPPAQRSPHRDPYSHLSSLQRDILRCITAARDRNAGRQGIYPSLDGLPGSREDSWEGLHVTAIIRAVSSHRRHLTPAVFLAAIEELMEKGHVFCPVDDSHYSCA